MPTISLHERSESSGRTWAFGPSIEEGILVGDGLMIVRPAQSKKHAKPWKEELLLKRGPRTFALRKWKLREGRIDISLPSAWKD